MGERRDAGLPLRRAVALPIRDVRRAYFHLRERRFIADRRRRSPGGRQLLGRAPVVAGVGINVRQPEHRMDAALVVVHVAGYIQGLFEKRQRRLRLPQGAQRIAAKNRHAIPLRVGVDGGHVDLVELFASRRVFGIFVVGIRAHEMLGQRGRLISVLRKRLQARNRRVDIGVAPGVHIDHRPHLEELNL
jgi:hypothetical protein